MDQITEGLLCNLYENDDDRYFILKVTDIEKQCGQSISFQLSFCIGNIIDYLEDDGINVQGMMDLQKKVKYGVSSETSISICEKICNERLIADKGGWLCNSECHL